MLLAACYTACIVAGSRLLAIPWNSTLLWLLVALNVFLLWQPFQTSSNIGGVIIASALAVIGLSCTWVLERLREADPQAYWFLSGCMFATALLLTALGLGIEIVERAKATELDTQTPDW